jgi:hypothetical protein
LAPTEKVDQQKLEALTRPAAPEPAPVPEEERPRDLQQANDKLSSLLGRPKE